MDCIMVGSISINLPAKQNTPKICSAPKFTISPHTVANLKMVGFAPPEPKRPVANTQQQIKTALMRKAITEASVLDKWAQKYEEENHRGNCKVITTKKGVTRFVPKRARDYRKERKERAENAKKELAKEIAALKERRNYNQLMQAGVQEISKISIGGAPRRDSETESRPVDLWGLNRSPKSRRQQVKPKVELGQKGFIALLHSLAGILHSNGLKFELIQKKTVKARCKRFQGVRRVVVELEHMSGMYKPMDLLIEPWSEGILGFIANKYGTKEYVNPDYIRPGCSGLVIPKKYVPDGYTTCSTNYFIVSGRYRGVLIDARVCVPLHSTFDIHYYNDPAITFWKGFTKTFQENKPSIIDHECSSDYDVEKCGSVSALLCQMLFPCGRITCSKCASLNACMDEYANRKQMNRAFNSLRNKLESEFAEFIHVKEFIHTYGKSICVVNENYAAFSEIQKMIGERHEAPFVHVNKLNEILIKGGTASSSEFAKAASYLLEVARYLKNRTENIQKGSLSSFRNKASAKAHVNTVLLCDNQLDKNGNFIWGTRGYHARRFFRNYFEVVNPENGYEQHLTRKGPNGDRKLAIGHLLMPTAFSALRLQLEGSPVTKFPITQACVSKRGEDFIYPCCCVTTESGAPKESTLYNPTRGHLVIGNTGDAKFIDLPESDDKRLFIVKEGYCYVNIFLAMLVNVNENSAKSFTKRVRDEIVGKLGKWPTMMDLATACHYLTMFYPETQNAELPRILVDHEHKTMHVIDAYGSKDTGFHILKAGTVSQLILFASNTLESEMKEYRVGGLISERDIESAGMKLLIRSIYRPKLFRQILVEEPHLITLSILSPGVLMAMYNSGSFEQALATFVKWGDSLSTVASTLALLATKVSLARTLNEQCNIIDAHASSLLQLHEENRGEVHASRSLVINTLRKMVAMSESNATLLDGGFFVFRESSKSYIEKSYLRQLEESWEELSVLEKYYAIRQSYTWRKVIRNSVSPRSTADLQGRYDISITALLKRSSVAMNKIVHRYINKSKTVCNKVKHCSLDLTCSIFRFLIPDVMRAVSILTVLSLFISMIAAVNNMLSTHKRLKIESAIQKNYETDRTLTKLHKALQRELKRTPTIEEYMKRVQTLRPDLEKEAKFVCVDFEEEPVTHQVKDKSQLTLQKVIAFVALIMMTFDPERSDCTYKILSKLKGLIGTIEQDVHHQTLDEIKLGLEEQNMKIDFEVDASPQVELYTKEPTFADWWSNQLLNNNVIPHYRAEGHFMEFTRETAGEVANSITHGPYNDILLRGAVGSGKSTGLPYHLSSRGRVLLLEPTRPLAENVCTQLRGRPFFASPTLRMRGLTSFGSSPITIMTSGYALHYLANNPQHLNDYRFIIFDECHVNDSSAMAFRCLLHEYSFGGKIIKVSATPPGREVEFKTQYPVTLITEENLSFAQFCEAQGTGAKCDVASTGENILVYVASYNEVDQLCRMLADRKYKTMKVDGRTMKLGKTTIEPKGMPGCPHFIVATNIIENGVTLDVDTVVDFGNKISPTLDVDCRCVRYGKQCVSYGERIQRLGRVGRHKPGKALRIGFTEKGQIAIPEMTATEAAFLCFTYGLPVMTHNVSVSLLSKCTVKQARTMQLFELIPFYTVNLVRYDGTMHKAIHDLLKPYRLRDSEVILNKMALPIQGFKQWMTAIDYVKCGIKLDMEFDVRIPFHARDIPEALHIKIFEALKAFRGDASFGKVSSTSACKIAYTLQTDANSIPRTLQLIDLLIAKEQEKHAHYQLAVSTSCSSFSYSLSTLSNLVKSRFQCDHSVENISVLQAAKAQILSFENLMQDDIYEGLNSPFLKEAVSENASLECIYHQSENALAEHLKLKGVWKKDLITRDILIMLGVIGGGCWMLYSHFKEKFYENVTHEAHGKRYRLKFRNARDVKMGREVYGDDDTIEHYFGDAYVKKGKTKGKTRGAGTKTRKFINMYGFDPTDFSVVRFVDPLTGCTMDENIHTDIGLVQEHFADVREEKIRNDELDMQHLYLPRANEIQAYYINNATKKALRVDLTPHNPLMMGRSGTCIAGFPERQNEMRQTGPARPVSLEDVPKPQESVEVEHEGKALFGGMRDYNPIASMVCQLTNESDGHVDTMFGIGYGPYIITNQHLFKRNNGRLTIRSRHGKFIIENTTTIKMHPCAGYDILIMRLPKDFPPFPQKLIFRQPVSGERICMVGSNFQEKSVISVISETSETMPFPNSHFWKHWISTKNGNCGLPLVATKDGNILGLHSLANFAQTQNYFANFPEGFQEKILNTAESLEWVQRWKYNSKEICWGSLKMHESVPDGIFKIHKLISDLGSYDVGLQSSSGGWMFSVLKDNLQAVAQAPSQLVTKHSVKGKCRMFELYLNENETARNFFKPLLGAYQPTVLSREAYIKDIMKYSTPIIIGRVDCEAFETVIDFFIGQLQLFGMEQCNYITCHEDIFSALNMKAAVGALYTGKKRDYFKEFSDEDKAEILKQSCFRLFSGKFGVWNGSLKSELRPQEKVLEGKTRTFTAAPLDTLLGAKSCVDDFNNQFYDLNIKAPWSVGMTKFYCGWNELLEGLPNGWVYCDADGSRFDSSLSPYLINSVLQIRLAFMEDWNIGEQMLRNLYTEIVYTPILTPDGTIVKKFKGNNSGQPSTVVDNTLMVIISMKYSLLKLGINLQDQDSICKYFVNGDDLLLAVRPDFEHILDGLQDLFATLGLNYEFTSRTREKSELWFMSHRGIQREGIYIPKLEMERVVSILEWDRSEEPAHRLEAICAAMVEAWGYDDLVLEIRKFYSWILDQAPFNALAQEGKAPYIAETALRKLYLNILPTEQELEGYKRAFEEVDEEEDCFFDVCHQLDETVDAGASSSSQGGSKSAQQDKGKETQRTEQERDVDVGTLGTFVVPRLKSVTSKMKLPKIGKEVILNGHHLLTYKPPQLELSNTRATHSQLKTWKEGVQAAYELDDEQIKIVLNGLVVWCIENGTSPNINGNWVMMDGEEQVEYPLKPILENAKPTFRQIMHHFSDVAEAYIEWRNTTEKYMPRYGRQRNLNDYQSARYAFDFYEITSTTPDKAREVHFQMKAAALRGTKTKTFGLDGKVGTTEENTERHTAEDVNANMHTLLGMRGM